MPKNKHPKRKLANKMLSNKERSKGVSVFNSKNWNKRADSKRKKQANQGKKK